MHAGALRALEFDRIVEAVRRFAQTPPGAARLAKLQPLTDRARGGGARWPRRPRRRASCATTQIALQAPEDLDALLLSLAVEGRVLEPLSLVNLAAFLASVEATLQRRAQGPQRLSAPARHRRDGGLVPAARSPTSAARLARRAKSSTMPARSWRACAIGCASSARGCAARSSRTCAAGTRRSICSSRSSPIATAATCSSCAASTAPRFRASSTAAPAAARACSSSRSARSRSTTTSSRSSSRRRRKFGASCSRWPTRCGARAARSAADGRRRDRARRPAGAGAVLAARRRRSSRRSPSDGRLELRAARHPLLIPAVRRHLGDDGDRDPGLGLGTRDPDAASRPRSEPRAPSPDPEPRSRSTSCSSRRCACWWSPDRIPAARPSRSRRPASCR